MIPILLLALLAPAGQTGSIEGVVRNDVTGAPVPRAVVTLVRDENLTASTDAAGRFAFHSLPLGHSFPVHVEASGFGGELLRMYSRQVDLPADKSRVEVEFRLLPEAVITGKVVDDAGAPAPSCVVRALTPALEKGKLHGRNYLQGITDDRGEYRIGRLQPGRYYVFAACTHDEPAPHPIMEAMRFRGPSRVHVPRYYPDATSPAGATRILVRTGAEVKGIDFKLPHAPVNLVRFRFLGSRPWALGGWDVSIQTKDPEGDVPKGYAVEFGDPIGGPAALLPPGSYVLTAVTKGEPVRAAHHTFELGSSVLLPVLVPMRRAVTLSGIAEFEPGLTDEIDQLGIEIRPLVYDSSMGHPPNPQFDGKGRFSIPGVWPGSWSMTIEGKVGYYPKSVTIGGKQVSPDNFEVTTGMTGPLRVVIGDKSGQVSGHIRGTAAQAVVFFWPIRSTKIDHGAEVSNGSFTSRSLAPGRHYVVAVETDNPVLFSFRPDLLEGIASRIRTVDVPERGTATIDLDVVRSEDILRSIEQPR